MSDNEKPFQPIEPIMMEQGPAVRWLKRLCEPYRAKEAYVLPNKPALIATAVNRPQICVMMKGEVIGQCNVPTDVNDYNAWQEVMRFLRVTIGVQNKT